MTILNLDNGTLHVTTTTNGVRWSLVDDGKTVVSVEGPTEVIFERLMSALRAIGYSGIEKDGLVYR